VSPENRLFFFFFCGRAPRKRRVDSREQASPSFCSTNADIALPVERTFARKGPTAVRSFRRRVRSTSRRAPPTHPPPAPRLPGSRTVAEKAAASRRRPAQYKKDDECCGYMHSLPFLLSPAERPGATRKKRAETFRSRGELRVLLSPRLLASASICWDTTTKPIAAKRTELKNEKLAKTARPGLMDLAGSNYLRKVRAFVGLTAVPIFFPTSLLIYRALGRMTAGRVPNIWRFSKRTLNAKLQKIKACSAEGPHVSVRNPVGDFWLAFLVAGHDARRRLCSAGTWDPSCRIHVFRRGSRSGLRDALYIVRTGLCTTHHRAMAATRRCLPLIFAERLWFVLPCAYFLEGRGVTRRDFRDTRPIQRRAGERTE